jgi:acetoin utilization protein AcuB
MMTAQDILSPTIVPIYAHMQTTEAMMLFDKSDSQLLPMLNENNEVLGMLSFETALKFSSLNERSLTQALQALNPIAFIDKNCHFFEIQKLFSTSSNTMYPVVDEEGKYLGCVTQQRLFEGMQQLLSVNKAGAIIVIGLPKGNFILSDIIRIIEHNDAKVLGLEFIEMADEIELHMRLNVHVLRGVLAALERFDYRVIGHFMRQDIQDDTDIRFRNLMKFIDI